MAVDRSYARLGLFLVVMTAVVVATAVFFVRRAQAHRVIEAVTYTEGNVSGLEISSPVRFRGVQVGQVEELRVEPRGSLIEIDFEVFLDRLTVIGANVQRIQLAAATGALESLRAQVVSNPVTGAAYLLLDAPSPTASAPIALTFKPSRTYVPATPTLMAKVEDRLPLLLDRTAATLKTLGDVIARAPDSLERADRFFAHLEQVIDKSDLPGLSRDSRAFFTTTSAQIEQMASNLDKSLGPGGTLERFADDMRTSIETADLAATTQSTREAMNRTNLAADDLRRNLPVIRDSLAQLRDLARLLSDQPEAVIYGTHPQKATR